jgi:hypothetical protein
MLSLKSVDLHTSVLHLCLYLLGERMGTEFMWFKMKSSGGFFKTP